MKKLFIAFAVFLVLAVAAGAVFLLTFDANRYREKIENEAAEFLGNPVKIGNIALVWRGGLALEVDGVQVFSNDEPVLTVDSAGAVLELAPLLRRSIQIGSVFIDGADIRVIKDSEGEIRILGVDLPKQDAAETVLPGDGKPVSANSSPQAISSFLISQVNFSRIHLYYQDDSALFPVQIDWPDLSLSVQNVSLFKPMTFRAEGAFFGAKKNINLSGVVKLENKGETVRLDDLKFEADLGLIQRDELDSSLPVLMKDVPFTDWGGKLWADVKNVKIRNGKPDSLRANVTLQNGFLEMPQLGRFVQKLDLTAENVSLTEPFEVQVKSAVFSESINMNFQGKIETSNLGRTIIGPARLDVDLNALNWGAVSSFNSGVLAAAPEGRLHADIRRISIEPGSSPLGDVNFRYDQGKIRLKDLPQALSNIQVTGNLRGDQLSLDAWNMNYGNSPAEGRLNVQNLFTAPLFRIEAKGRNILLSDILPPSAPKEPSMEGTLFFNVSVGGRGKVPEAIIPSLAGSGNFRVENGVVRNLNLLEEVLSKLSAIPGLGAALNQRMSDSLKARRARPDTPFETIDEDFSIENGLVRFGQFDAVTPNLKLSGPVTLGFDTSVQARPVIWIHEEIMAELVERVHELAYALNKQGQLQVPVAVSGTLAQMSIFPDVQFLLGEIVRNKAGQMLSSQLMKKAEGNEKLDMLSQFLGTTTSPQNSGASQNTGTASSSDNTVPVRVHSSQPQQSKPSNTEIAAGLINAFLSNSSSSSDGSGT